MSSAKVQAARVLLAYGWGAPNDGDETERASLVINILRMAIGQQQMVSAEPVIVQRLTNSELSAAE